MMTVAKYFTGVLTLVALCCTDARASDNMYKVSYLRQACNEWIRALDNNQYKNTDEIFRSGICVGTTIAAVSTFIDEVDRGSKSCPVGFINNDQAARIFVKFANEHPERFGEDSLAFFVEALRKAFHC
jgi:hypothetical protein